MAADRRRVIQCPTCQTTIRLPDAARAGTTFRCPKCGQKSQLQPVAPVGAPPPPAGWQPPPGLEPASSRSVVRTILIGLLALGILAGSAAVAYFVLPRRGGTPPVAGPGGEGGGEAGAGDPANGGGAAAGPVPELALKVQEILKANCHRCHGDGGSNEGGFNFVLRRDKLVEPGGYVVAGKPGDSRLLERIKSGEMPPEGNPVAAADIEILRQWIEAGAPDFAVAEKRDFLTTEAVFDFIQQDLIQKTPERDRRFVRYFTLTHLYNAGLSEDEMQTYRVALSKLLNSLSWNRTLVQPTPLDPAKTVLRVDLRDLEWTDDVWRKVISADPYAVVHKFAKAEQCQSETECQVPSVRGDWFVSAASQPPLYYDVMQFSKEKPMEELQHLLRVDVSQNLVRRRVARAGFNGSAVSQNNRLIERHNSPYGALWVSYDFAGNTGRKNLFDHPLGPGTEDKHFEHDGGEIIFNLPNGLQGYLLVDANNGRLDKGPTTIVSDERRPDRAVTNGLSCMSCHYAGIIVKEDSIRGHVLANRTAFPESEDILALYSDRVEMTKLQTDDAKRFQDACRAIGIDRFTSTSEPVVNMALRFEADLDRKLASAELGLTPEQFALKLAGAPNLARVLGPLNVDRGTLKREVFVKHFAEAAKAFGLGSIFNEKAGSSKTETPQVVKGNDTRVGPAGTTPTTPPSTQPDDLPPGETNLPGATPEGGKPQTPVATNDTPKTIRPGLVRNWADRRGKFLAHGELIGFEGGKTVQIMKVNGGVLEIDIDLLAESNQRVIFDHVSSEPPGDLPETPAATVPYRSPPVVRKPPAEFRIWTPTTGDREPFEAAYLSVVGSGDRALVVLKKPDGEVVRGPIDGLSEEDQAYISERRVGNRRPPGNDPGPGAEGPEGQPGPGQPGAEGPPGSTPRPPGGIRPGSKPGAKPPSARPPAGAPPGGLPGAPPPGAGQGATPPGIGGAKPPELPPGAPR